MKEPTESRRRQAVPRLLATALLAVLTLALYWPVRHYDFISYDDPEFVSENPQIQAGLKWSTVRYAFSTPVVSNWHPLTVLSHALDCQLFGTIPGPHHLVNAVLHSANAILLFWLLYTLTSATWRSGLVAALFALHPLRVESVAWVAERKDLLSGLFFLISLLLYVRYVRANAAGKPSKTASSDKNGARWVFYWAGVLAFALGLMSKPMIVTLPFVLLLLDYWPLRRFASAYPGSPWKRLAQLTVEKSPFLVLSLVAALITFFVQSGAGATHIVGRARFGERLANAISSYVRYLGKQVWPTKLAVIYPHPARHYYLSNSWPAWEILAAGLLLILISVLAWRWRRRRPYFAFGWCWFLGMLVPVIGLVQAGEQAMADRYTYLPMIGPVITLVWWLGEECVRWSTAGISRAAWAGSVALLILLFAVTREQLHYWQNTLSLFEHAAQVTADNPSAQFGVGMGLLEQGQVSRAMVRFRVALAIDPSYTRAHYVMGQLLRMKGNLPAAAEQYQAALRGNPSDIRAMVNYAGVLPQLGQAKDAIDYLNQALRLDPDSVEALNNLAWLLATRPEPNLRDGPKAVQMAERACELTQFKEAALIGTLGAAYAEAGQFTQAVATAQRAITVATTAGESALATRNRQLLELYRAGKSYREKSDH